MELCLGRFFSTTSNAFSFVKIFLPYHDNCSIVAFLKPCFLYVVLFGLFSTSWHVPGYCNTFFPPAPSFDWEDLEDIPLIVAWSPKPLHCCRSSITPIVACCTGLKFILHQMRVRFGPLSSSPITSSPWYLQSYYLDETVRVGFTSSWRQRRKNCAVLHIPNDPNTRRYSEGERGKCGRSLTLLEIRPNHWKHVIVLILPSLQRNTQCLIIPYL